MTTYNFTNASIAQVPAPPEHETKEDWITVRRNIINCARQNLDAGDGDVAQCVNIPAGTTVLDAWVRVITAETANATLDLGYGSDVDYWGNALAMDSTGIAPAILHASSTWNAATIADGNELATDVTVAGAVLGDVVYVSAALDVADLTLVGAVTAADTVTLQLGNWTGGNIDLVSFTYHIYVDKAPLRRLPLYFASADTIDVVATTDVADVDFDACVFEVVVIMRKTLNSY